MASLKRHDSSGSPTPPTSRTPLLPKKRSPSPSSYITTSSSSFSSVTGTLTPLPSPYIPLLTSLLLPLSAGSLLIFSLWTPTLLSPPLSYTSLEISLITTLASFLTYSPVPFFGWICDTHGPHILSLLSAFFFSLGYTLAALTVERAWGYQCMMGAFGLVGMGTSAMYFAGVTTCAKVGARVWPERRGLVMASPIAAFGVCGAWMTQCVTMFGMKPNGEVDTGRVFWTFAVYLGLVGLWGGFGLRGVNEEVEDEEDEEEEEKGGWVNEETRKFLSDRTMWWFAAGVFLVTGPGEAFINNMGTLIQTLPPIPTTSLAPLTTKPPVSPATHVSLIAATSTISRLLAGSLSDYLAPKLPSLLPGTMPGAFPTSSRFTLSRIPLLLISSGSMLLGLLLVASGYIYQHPTHFFLVSSGIGVGYGAVFCLAPTVVSVVWGTRNFGTNWGIVTMTPAIGAGVFGILFGAEFDAGKDEAGRCVGWHCSRGSFGIMAAAVLIAIGLWTHVWGRWKHRGVVV